MSREKHESITASLVIDDEEALVLLSALDAYLDDLTDRGRESDEDDERREELAVDLHNRISHLGPLL